MPHPSKMQEPVPRSALRNSVRANEEKRKSGTTTKKGGRGGKFTWGRAGDEFLDEIVTVLDRGDPNFDDETAPVVIEASL